MNQRNEKTQAGNESWRVFCAVDVPESARRLFLQHIARLKQGAPEAQVSWARDASLHLTLKFLGEIQQTSVVSISNAAARAATGLTPFSVQLEHTGVFPNHGAPRVLWVGINDLSGKLIELHTRLELEAAKEGFEKENRRFQPHLTLARIRKPQHAHSLAAVHRQMALEPVSIEISELLVIKSELSSAGSRYTLISRHALRLSDTL